MALAAQVIDVAQRSGADTNAARNALAEASSTLSAASVSSREALNIVMKVLRKLASRKATHPGHNTFTQLDALISPRLRETITLNEIARELGQPASTITYRLQKNFGLSFTEYVGRLRVEEAKRMLRRTRLSATEISRRVGIGDQSYFSKIFKRHTGLNPTEYRARHGSK